MKYFAIDTSGEHLTVILENDGKIYSKYIVNCGVKHSVSLLPAIEELAIKSEIDLKSIDFFACVVGAGSFTGIRIGVSTVKAFCFAYNKPCLSITSFDTIAYNKENEKVLSIIDAGHDGYYVCGYDNCKVDLAPSYILKDNLLKLENEYKFISSKEISGIKTETVDISAGLIKAIEKNAKNLIDANDLVPLYVRKSQAEEGRCN